MNITPHIERLQAEVSRLNHRIAWFNDHAAQLAELPEASDSNGAYTHLDFDNLSHDDVVAVIKALGGKWNKNPSFDAARIDYTAEIDGVIVRCWQGEPPPACKVVETEELVPEMVIPASVRKVRKIVCPKPEPDQEAEEVPAPNPDRAFSPAQNQIIAEHIADHRFEYGDREEA